MLGEDEPTDDSIDDGKELLANANLMQSLGRTLWKVADALLKHQKDAKGKCVHVVPDAAAALEKMKIVDEIMYDRLYRIEVKYADALAQAGVFNESRPKPKHLHPRAAKTREAMSQPQTSVPESAKVAIMRDGTIDLTLSVGEVVKTLGLQGHGVGGLVAVRDISLLLGSGVAFTATEARIVELNPPEAVLSVKGIDPKSYEPIVRELTVSIDDLVAVDQEKEVIDEQNPSKKACESAMSRLPGFDYNKNVQKWMHVAIEELLEECACAMAGGLEDLLEAVNVSNGLQKGLSVPIVQCRAKASIPTGALRLFPHGGVLVSKSAMSQRSPLEARLKGLDHCYMRGATISINASRKTKEGSGPYMQQFLLYSPCSEKGLVTTSAAGSVELGYVAPYWAVMLTDRDNQQLVNMHPYVEEFKLNNPTETYFTMKFKVTISVKMPFLTNKSELKCGELLVLPYDGGTAEIFTVPPQ